MVMNARGPKPLNFISYCTVSFKPSASVTSTVIGRVPVNVGFPDRMPVVGFSVRPLSVGVEAAHV